MGRYLQFDPKEHNAMKSLSKYEIFLSRNLALNLPPNGGHFHQASIFAIIACNHWKGIFHTLLMLEMILHATYVSNTGSHPCVLSSNAACQTVLSVEKRGGDDTTGQVWRANVDYARKCCDRQECDGNLSFDGVPWEPCGSFYKL